MLVRGGVPDPELIILAGMEGRQRMCWLLVGQSWDVGYGILTGF